MRKPISKKLRFEVLQRDGFRCQYCGADSDNAELHLDHVIPVSAGGENDLWNLLTSCSACNLGKRDGQTDKVLVKDWMITADSFEWREGDIWVSYAYAPLHGLRGEPLHAWAKNRSRETMELLGEVTHGQILRPNRRYVFEHRLNGRFVEGLAPVVVSGSDALSDFMARWYELQWNADRRGEKANLMDLFSIGPCMALCWQE